MVGGAQSPQAPTPGAGPTSSGQFENLDKYLQVNSGQGFGEKVAGKLQGEVDSANQAREQAGATFKAQSDSGTTSFNQGIVDDALKDPTKFVGDQKNIDEFNKQRDAKYGGPNNLGDTPALYNQTFGTARAASDKARASESEGGRFQILTNYFNRPSYSQGEKSLDNLLIQNDPNTQQAFKNIRQQADATQQAAEGQKTALASFAAQNRGTTEDARRKTRAALGIDDAGNLLKLDDTKGNGAIQDAVEGMDARVKQRQADLSADRLKFNGLQGKQRLGDLSPELLAAMGLDPSQYGATNNADMLDVDGENVGAGEFFGVDPYSNDFNQFVNEADLNRGNVGSKDDMARLNALSKLAGLENTYVSNPDDAGKYSQGSLSTFKKDDFGGRVGNSRDAFSAEMKAAKAHFDQVAAGGGLVNTPDMQRAVNDIRQKYGLPRVGNEAGATRR